MTADLPDSRGILASTPEILRGLLCRRRLTGSIEAPADEWLAFTHAGRMIALMHDHRYHSDRASSAVEPQSSRWSA